MILSGMLKIIFRELTIFAVCVSIFPGALFWLYFRGDIGPAQLHTLFRDIVSIDVVGPWPLVNLLGKMLVPYLLVQAMRAYKWSKISITGLRYANLYFATLLFGVVIWSWGQSLDLLLFMNALDDLPAELPQFAEMESTNLLIGTVALYLSYRCFSVYLYAPDASVRKNADRISID